MERIAVDRVGDLLTAAGVEFDVEPDGLPPGALVRTLVRALGLPETTRVHRCMACGAMFIGHFSCSYCSVECEGHVRSERQAVVNEKRSERRAIARLTTCEVCGVSFAPERSGAKTCSGKCRQRAYRRRQSETKAPAVDIVQRADTALPTGKAAFASGNLEEMLKAYGPARK